MEVVNVDFGQMALALFLIRYETHKQSNSGDNDQGKYLSLMSRRSCSFGSINLHAVMTVW